MAVDMSAIHRQAEELCAYETRLAQATNRLRAYREAVCAGWQGEEAADIARAIGQALAQISYAQNQLVPLAQDIRQAAEEVRREEVAAAAQARRQARLRQTRQELEEATEARDGLLERLNGLLPASMHADAWTALPGTMGDSRVKAAWSAYQAAVRRVEELRTLLEALSK